MVDDSDEEDVLAAVMHGQPAVQRKNALRFGDKFTKKPIQIGKYLVMLGRIHVHLMDLETRETKVLISIGEDQAEKVGYLLRQNPDMIADAM